MKVTPDEEASGAFTRRAAPSRRCETDERHTRRLSHSVESPGDDENACGGAGG